MVKLNLKMFPLLKSIKVKKKKKKDIKGPHGGEGTDQGALEVSPKK